MNTTERGLIMQRWNVIQRELLPELHNQSAFGSIHFAGVMVLALITASCQKWPPAPPAPPAFASLRVFNSPWIRGFARGSGERI